MKKSCALAVVIFLLTSTSFAKYDDEKFCMMQGYAFASDDLKFYSGLLLRILIHRGISAEAKCVNAQNTGKGYFAQINSAFTANGFDPSKISPAAQSLAEDFAAFTKRIDGFILKNTGYLD